MKIFTTITLCLLYFPALALAQQTSSEEQMQGMQMGSRAKDPKPEKKKKTDDMQGMPGMDHKQMPDMQMGQDAMMNMHPDNFIQEMFHQEISATGATPIPPT